MKPNDQSTLDLAADIIWWLKGYTTSEEYTDISQKHIEAIATIRGYILELNHDSKALEVAKHCLEDIHDQLAALHQPAMAKQCMDALKRMENEAEMPF